jgi:hypothetical protein
MNSRTAAAAILLGATLLAGCAKTVQSQFPEQTAAEVCPDAPLRLVFTGPVTLGTRGRIVIRDGMGAPADIIDLAAIARAPAPSATGGFSRPPSAVSRLVGGVTLRYQPVVVDGNAVTIRPHVTLAYGRIYTVEIEPGVIIDEAGHPWQQSADGWSFATRSAPPAASAATLTVAADGTGDFCTVQGAIDFVPAGHAGRTTILVRRGVYHELVNIPKGKDRITLRGEDRHGSVIACANNAVLNPQHRTMMGVLADDIVIQNLTLHNLTPHGGRQAETLQVRSDRCFLLDDDFASFQDTLRLDGLVYVKNCFVAGDVDFIWGAGTIFFDRCTLRALNSGFLVQSRNNAQRVGYVFADCTIETAPGATHVVLARIHPKGYPYSNVDFIRCRMGPGIASEGWELDQGTDRDHLPVDNSQSAPNVHFWEYQSTDLSGQPLDVSHRLPVSRQLTAIEAGPLSDPARVLGAWVTAVP